MARLLEACCCSRVMMVVGCVVCCDVFVVYLDAIVVVWKFWLSSACGSVLCPRRLAPDGWTLGAVMPLCRLLVTGGWCTSVVVAGCGVCCVCWMLGGWITKRHDLWVPSQYHVVKDRLDTACQYADW